MNMFYSVLVFVHLAIFINILVLCNAFDDSVDKSIAIKKFNPRRLVCSNLPMKRRASCRRAFRRLAAQIQDSFLTIDNSTIALRYRNVSGLEIQGWCTSSTFIRYQKIMLKLNSALNIPISTNILYDSVDVNIVAPSTVSGEFNVRHRVGVPTFGKGCRQLYKDDFKMYGSAKTAIRMKGTFSINASMKTTPKNYVIRIRPIADIDYSLKSSLDISWEYSGLNNVAAYIVRRLRVYVDQLLNRTVKSAMSDYDEVIKLRLKANVDQSIRTVFRTNRNGVRVITIPRLD